MRQLSYLPAIVTGLALSGCVYVVSDENVTATHGPASDHTTAVTADVNGPGHGLPAPVLSDAGFDVTLVRLRNAITRRGLTLFDEIDHQANAKAAGLDMAPNTVFIFGNPKAGTPLMQAAPELGLALPLRAQVYEQDGHVYVRTTPVGMMTRHHDLSSLEAITDKVAATLSDITAEATTAG